MLETCPESAFGPWTGFDEKATFVLRLRLTYSPQLKAWVELFVSCYHSLSMPGWETRGPTTTRRMLGTTSPKNSLSSSITNHMRLSEEMCGPFCGLHAHGDGDWKPPFHLSQNVSTFVSYGLDTRKLPLWLEHRNHNISSRITWCAEHVEKPPSADWPLFPPFPATPDFFLSFSVFCLRSTKIEALWRTYFDDTILNGCFPPTTTEGLLLANDSAFLGCSRLGKVSQGYTNRKVR